uniref:Uncharacterized protein n=1 Tax=Oryza meridionalis TaxID=40149 RepID=A0A0E0DZ77_9ORYZ
MGLNCGPPNRGAASPPLLSPHRRTATGGGRTHFGGVVSAVDVWDGRREKEMERTRRTGEIRRRKRALNVAIPWLSLDNLAEVGKCNELREGLKEVVLWNYICPAYYQPPLAGHPIEQ